MIKNKLCEEIIKRVTHRKNIILIEFNKNMDVKGEHSYLIVENYVIKKENTMCLLPKDTNIEVIKNGYIIKMILPLGKNYLNDRCDINLGYIFGNKIFYIESTDGIVNFPFNSKNMGEEVEELNLKNGTCEIIDNCILKYLYTGRNEFSYVDIEDFYVEKNNTIYNPKSLTINNNKEIIFKFNNPIFHGKNDNVYLKARNFPKSKDKYDFLMAKNTFIKIKDRRIIHVETLSFSNYENNQAFLKIKFSKPLLVFNPKDFYVKFEDKKYNIKFLSLDCTKTIIEILVNSVTVESFINDIFKLCMSVKYEDVKSIGYSGEKVFIEGEINSKYFISNTISWDLFGADLKNSLINIGFEEEIILSSIITNSNFNLKVKKWNNRILVIPPGKIIVGYNNENEQMLSLSNNENFGKIIITFKNNIKYKMKTQFNSEPAILYLKDKNLFIRFHEKESLDLNFSGSENIKYYPGKNIKNIKDYFAFYGYHPIGKINASEIIINLNPLQDESKNPFQGGEIKASYILNVDNKNRFRTYGTFENTTVIEGFLKILGNLKFNEMIFIKNLKVTGKIYINIGEGSIELNKLECNDLLYK